MKQVYKYRGSRESYHYQFLAPLKTSKLKIMRCLCLIVILSATLHCNAQEENYEESREENREESVFATIFASNGEVFKGKSDNFNNFESLKKFDRVIDRAVTALAVYKHFLFVSVKRNNFWSSNFEIFRANITDFNNMTINPNTWRPFHSLGGLLNDVTCMTVGDKYIFAGLTDGTVVRCSAEKKDLCEVLQTFDDKAITGIDYNPTDGNVYVTTNTNKLFRCSKDIDKVCENIVLPAVVNYISAFKIRFDAFWFSVRKNFMFWKTKDDRREGKNVWLMKCPFSQLIGETKNEFRYCRYFEKHPDHRLINSIDFTDKYLYFTLENNQSMWRCDPKRDWSCDWIETRMHMDTFIMV